MTPEQRNLLHNQAYSSWKNGTLRDCSLETLRLMEQAVIGIVCGGSGPSNGALLNAISSAIDSKVNTIARAESAKETEASEANRHGAVMVWTKRAVHWAIISAVIAFIAATISLGAWFWPRK